MILFFSSKRVIVTSSNMISPIKFIKKHLGACKIFVFIFDCFTESDKQLSFPILHILIFHKMSCVIVTTVQIWPHCPVCGSPKEGHISCHKCLVKYQSRRIIFDDIWCRLEYVSIQTNESVKL